MGNKDTDDKEPKKGPRQQAIPGTSDDRIKALDAAAEKYQDAKLARVKASTKELEARAALEDLMREHKRKIYRSDATGLVVEMVAKDVHAKVTKIGDEDGDGGTDD